MSQDTVTRRDFLCTGTLAAVSSLSVFARSAAPVERKPPNIVLVLTDDQRWDTLGCMGNPVIKTPHIDALAAEGILFENNFCTTSICMSSRASILTGQYSRTHEINDFNRPLSADQLSRTYPGLLRRNGYYTGFIGKWGLGGALPREHYDYFEGFTGQGQYFHEIDGQSVHLTQIIENQTQDFFGQLPADRPFCLSVSTKAPHVQDGHPDPFRYDPRYKDLYQNDSIPPPHTATPIHFDRQPEFIRNSEGRTRWTQRFSTEELRLHSVRNYFRLITGVDRLVGTIMNTLREKRLQDNTVILFTSDNGFFLGEHGLAGKWLMYEESIRTPLLIMDPRMEDGKKGQRRKDMTLNVDLVPTLLNLAGVDTLSSLQGLNLYDRNSGWPTPGEHQGRGEWFYEHLYDHQGKIPQCEGIRTNRWKYIHYPEHGHGSDQLFDLRHDPYEAFNLAGHDKYRETLEFLRQRRQAWIDSLEQGRELDELYFPQEVKERNPY